MLKAGPVEVRGVAWTGNGVVTKLEIATGAGAAWSRRDPPGRSPKPRNLARVVPTLWDREAGPTHVLKARATDSNGEVQPETTPWNRSGYLWNGIDKITCEVR